MKGLDGIEKNRYKSAKETFIIKRGCAPNKVKPKNCEVFIQEVKLSWMYFKVQNPF